jgi:hypothetical protein
MLLFSVDLLLSGDGTVMMLIKPVSHRHRSIAAVHEAGGAAASQRSVGRQSWSTTETIRLSGRRRCKCSERSLLQRFFAIYPIRTKSLP